MARPVSLATSRLSIAFRGMNCNSKRKFHNRFASNRVPCQKDSEQMPPAVEASTTRRQTVIKGKASFLPF